MIKKTTIRKLLSAAAANNGESFESLVVAIDSDEIDREFDDGYGGDGGASFTAWGPSFVYFPVTYDSSNWVGSVPRNPNGVRTEPHGGG